MPVLLPQQTSLIPNVLDALVAQFTSVLPTTLEVKDGPPTTDVPRSGVYVGATSDLRDIPFEQSIPTYGPRRRDERFDIPNLMYLRVGDNNLAAVRTEVFGYLAMIEASLRADQSLGFPQNTVQATFATSGTYSQNQTPNGVVCRIAFTITVISRI